MNLPGLIACLICTPAAADIGETELRDRITCVARYLDVDVPDRLPEIRIVSRARLVASVTTIPAGWDRASWARNAGGLFWPVRRGVIVLEPSGRSLVHELAHWLLWANGKRWQHGEYVTMRALGFTYEAPVNAVIARVVGRCR